MLPEERCNLKKSNGLAPVPVDRRCARRRRGRRPARRVPGGLHRRDRRRADHRGAQKILLGRLAAHKIPRLFVSVDAIPLTARGKTDRERLRALAQPEMVRAGML